MRILMSLILLLGALQLPAQEPKINKRPIKQTSAASGKEMFASYCSACHGAGGKGDGPAASAFKKAPRNLTKLAQDNGGKYPAAMVFNTLNLREGSVHGSKVMPVWGPVLSTVSENQDELLMRINNLVNYIGTLQEH